MSLLSVWMLELSLYTHGPLLRTMKFQLSVCPYCGWFWLRWKLPCRISVPSYSGVVYG